MTNKYIVEERLNRKNHPAEPARWLHVYDDLEVAKGWVDGSILDMRSFGFACMENTLTRPLWAFNSEHVYLYTVYDPDVSNGDDSNWERKFIIYELDGI